MEPKNEMSAVHKTVYRVILLVSGLTSVTSSFLLPVFMYKGWKTRQREEWVHCCILAITTLLQLSVLLSVGGSDTGVASRFAANEFSPLGVSLFHLVYPFTSQSFFDLQWVFGVDQKIVLTLIRIVGNVKFAWPRPSELLLSISVSLLFSAVAWRRRRELDFLLISSAFLIVTACSVILSVKMTSSPRYAFAPSFMLLTLFTGELRKGNSVWLKTACLSLLSLFILFSPLDFRNNACFNPEFPIWRNELALWRQNSSYKIRLWPQELHNHWELELKGK